jgi:SAM-dependent methyltransferase
MALLKRLTSTLLPGLRLRSKEQKWAKRMKARQKVFESDLWGQDSDFAQRKYASYDDYVKHQSSKLDRIHDRLQAREDEDMTMFLERFQGCPALADAQTVLCLGARLGTEVMALHKLGRFAVGIDLNPGPDNEYVLKGDFHKIVFPDTSLDAVYCNALDHVYDLEKVLGEVGRLLRPGGIFVADIISGYEEGFYAGGYESVHWRNAGEFAEKVALVSGFALESTLTCLKANPGNEPQRRPVRRSRSSRQVPSARGRAPQRAAFRGSGHVYLRGRRAAAHLRLQAQPVRDLHQDLQFAALRAAHGRGRQPGHAPHPHHQHRTTGIGAQRPAGYDAARWRPRPRSLPYNAKALKD